MFESMTKVVSQNELKVLVSKHLLTDTVGSNIEKACQGIYPLQNVCYKISQMGHPGNISVREGRNIRG